MSRALHTLLLLAWGLWLGGLIMLFISVQSLFNTFSQRHDIAGEGAAEIFRCFSYYHLALAAAALLASFGWRVLAPARLKTLVFVLFAVAALAAVYLSAVLTPQMEQLRTEGLTHGAAFRRLHGISMGIYMLETIFVFIAGWVMPWVDRAGAGDRRSEPSS